MYAMIHSGLTNRGSGCSAVTSLSPLGLGLSDGLGIGGSMTTCVGGTTRWPSSGLLFTFVGLASCSLGTCGHAGRHAAKSTAKIQIVARMDKLYHPEQSSLARGPARKASPGYCVGVKGTDAFS